MRCGISTACFYPEETLESLKRVIDAGATVTELFINTISELKDDYLAKILDLAQSAGVSIVSVHPFFSPMEGFLFASDYVTRFADGLNLYKMYFEAGRILGADKLVFHGDHAYNAGKFPVEEYAQRFIRLARAGREYGMDLCHENVAWCRLNSAKSVLGLRPLLGEYAAFVLDIKQVQRRRGSLPAMIRAMGGALRHVHISDHKKGENCLPPGSGELDYPAFLQNLAAVGYKGDLIIELYRQNFQKPEELARSMRYIQSLIQHSI